MTHEIAQLKRLKFAKRGEQLSPAQASLLDDLIDTDIAAIEAELQALQPAPNPTETKQKPKRTALPPEFPRTLIHHEPDNTHYPCGWLWRFHMVHHSAERLYWMNGERGHPLHAALMGGRAWWYCLPRALLRPSSPLGSAS
ncbi:hypothetical protein DENIT_20187 [Pseudomonas veronii]|nr:hypothetical protein DENIT_20187 [Pseudomonas veronii]